MDLSQGRSSNPPMEAHRYVLRPGMLIFPDGFRPKSDKEYGFPPVVLLEDPRVNGERIGGAYFRPSDTEIEFGGLRYRGQRGLIIVRDDDESHTTIAHEWRHHWQWCNGWEYDGLGWPPTRSYENDIRRYFRGSRSELDALVYEFTWTKSERNEHWVDLVFTCSPSLRSRRR